jgi:methionine-rich copper-binding protein CopC
MRSFSRVIAASFAIALAASTAFAHAQLEKACAVPLGAAKTEAGNQAVLVVPITKALAAGAYTVHWQAVSVDTHHTQGTFDFTVKP